MKKLLEGMGYILKSLKKKKTKKRTEDQLSYHLQVPGKATTVGSTVSSIPLLQRSGGSGLSAKEKKAWVKANTPKDKRKALGRSRTIGRN